MIKIIISHDVDHLFARDHWFRDLIYPKMWVRSSLELVKQEITVKEWWLRCISCFRKNRHNLEAVMNFDKKHGVPSTFFFGMNQGLGMSYKPEEAKPVILKVHKCGFSVGVHGIDYQSFKGMKKEYDTFKKLVGFEPCGIRMHYVRYDEKTFNKLNHIGYTFDTTEFNKSECGTTKDPYKIGNMWEFPLAIMDGYLPQKYDLARARTIDLLERCKKEKLQYITILFHDSYYCNDYLDMKKWYQWLIEFFCDSPEYEFVSYKEAIRELRSEM